MTGHRFRGTAAAATLALAALTMTACTEDPKPPTWSSACPAQAGPAVTLVVGSRANSPRIQVPEDVRTLIHHAALAGHKVQVVGVDGVPTVALTATFQTDGQSAQIRQRDLENFLAQTTKFVGDLQPKEPEADLLAALTQAGQITPDGGTIVVMDSGLATAGPLSYQNPDMFGATPADVVSFLSAQSLLPNLAQRSVVFVGLGDTADPQPRLDGQPHAQVGEVWRTVAQKAGAACVADLRAAPTRSAVPTTVPVTVVQPPVPKPFTQCGTTVLPDSSPVGFVVNTATFRDPGAAQSTLESLAKTLKDNPKQLVTLTGTTSSEGTDAANQTLSEQRAEAVKKVLIGLGVGVERITAKGAGEHWPGRKPDMSAAGVLDPAAAAHNRSVVVELTCR